MQDLTRLDIQVLQQDVERMSGLLGIMLSCGWEEIEQPDGNIIFRIHVENPAFCEELSHAINAWFPGLNIIKTSVPVKDWSLAWREFFTPVPIKDRFIIVAPWMKEATPNKVQNGKHTPIIIEPRMAFGTGHHASTALCLEAISDLAEKGSICPGSRFLDVGTGSGILAIACAKLGMWGVAADLDPLAVENAVHNRSVNNATSSIDIRLGSIESVEGDKFDCVLANILAEPLKLMAQDLVKLIALNGKLVLSGILTTQADDVEKAYQAAGLGKALRYNSGEWTALVW